METFLFITEDFGLGKRMWEIVRDKNGKFKAPELKVQRPSHGALKSFSDESLISVSVYKKEKANLYTKVADVVTKPDFKFNTLLKNLGV